jgi:hypothetical protein
MDTRTLTRWQMMRWALSRRPWCQRCSPTSQQAGRVHVSAGYWKQPSVRLRRVEFCYVAAMKSYLALWRTVTWHWSVHAAEKEMAAEQPERFEQERGALLGLLAVACLKGDVNTTAAKLRIKEQLNNGDAAALELACDERLVHVLMVASSEITQLYAGIFVKYVKMGVLAFGALGALLLALIIVWW